MSASHNVVLYLRSELLDAVLDGERRQDAGDRYAVEHALIERVATEVERARPGLRMGFGWDDEGSEDRLRNGTGDPSVPPLVFGALSRSIERLREEFHSARPRGD